MKKTDDILSKVGHRDGMTVPEGYFEDFAARMISNLPDNPDAEKRKGVVLPKTIWGRIRPYAYMAAMFAGIWCMLKMFTMMSPDNVDLSIENNLVLTEALSDDNFVYDYIQGDISERELYEEMWDDSIAVEDIVLPEDMEELPEVE